MSGKDSNVLADSQETLSEKSSEEKVRSNPSSPQSNQSSPSNLPSNPPSPQIHDSSLPPSKNTRSHTTDKRNLSQEETTLNEPPPKKQKDGNDVTNLVKCGMCPRNVPKELLEDELAFKKKFSLCDIEYFNHQNVLLGIFILLY